MTIQDSQGLWQERTVKDLLTDENATLQKFKSRTLKVNSRFAECQEKVVQALQLLREP